MLKVIWFVPPAIQALAERRGILADRGVDIHGVLTTSSDEQFQVMLDGSQDAAVTAMDNVVTWNRRVEGRQFRIIGQVEATTAISLLARPQFATIEALRGRRLLVDSAENGFVVALRVLLANAGVEFGECEVIASGGVKERFGKLIGGEGDATLLGPPFVGMAELAGMHRLANADEEFPGFPGQGIVIRAGLPAHSRDEVVRWLGGLEQARAEARNDATSAASDLLPLGIDPVTSQTLIRSVANTLIPDRAGVELLIGQRRSLGLPGAGVTYDDLVDLALLADAGARVEY